MCPVRSVTYVSGRSPLRTAALRRYGLVKQLHRAAARAPSAGASLFAAEQIPVDFLACVPEIVPGLAGGKILSERADRGAELRFVQGRLQIRHVSLWKLGWLGLPSSRPEGATAEEAMPLSKPSLSIVIDAPGRLRCRCSAQTSF